jgi:hypothetical protein
VGADPAVHGSRGIAERNDVRQKQTIVPVPPEQR